MTMTQDTASPASPDGALSHDDGLGDDRLLEREVLAQDRREDDEAGARSRSASDTARRPTPGVSG